ncbi:hypothetical protein TCAL_15559 [Tigriopus californicus]|uniref:CUB domain-containing protein n=1 Tax=Tigriopus californicus TaxID=6832 RepID=A0A553PAG6_TIGCA|nr:hypothetical protein TCAL_15559 [Tigriopus californicus]
MSPKGSLVAIFHLLFYTLFSFELVQSEGQNSNVQQTNFHRQKRLFSLFNVVQFQNGPCITASDIETTGTCLNGQECTSQGGTLDGNCASGFGVCCVFILTGCNGVVNQVFSRCCYSRRLIISLTISYFSELHYGSEHGISGSRLQHRPNLFGFTKSVIARLDFQSRTVLPLGTGEGVCGGTGDSLNVISPHSSSQSAFPPTVCGTLTGQHSFCSVQYAESPITTPDPFELTADMKVRTDCGQVNQISIPSSVLVKQGANADEFRFAPSERCGSVFGALPRTEIPSTLTSARGLPFVVNVRTRPASVADNDFSGFSLDYSQIPC